MVDIPPFIFSFIDFLLNHRFAVSELDADGFRVLHRDFGDDLPDELIVKFCIACGAFHDSVPHLPASGSLLFQIDLCLLCVRDLCLKGFLLIRQRFHSGIQLGIGHVDEQPVQHIAFLPAHRVHTLLQLHQLRASLK